MMLGHLLAVLLCMLLHSQMVAYNWLARMAFDGALRSNIYCFIAVVIFEVSFTVLR